MLESRQAFTREIQTRRGFEYSGPDFHILNLLDFLLNPLRVAHTTVPVAGKLNIQPSNGTPPYTYKFESGGGTITSKGILTAPANPVVITVRITDSRGYYVTQLIRVLGGSGNGTFASPVSIPSCSSPQYVDTGDLNSDGNWDVVVACSAPGPGVYVHLGKGDGTFENVVAYGGAGNVNFLAVGDFNGDGIPDIAAPFDGTTNPGLGIYNGNGDGTFQAYQGHVDSQTAKTSGTMIAEDLNGDGIHDLVHAAQTAVDVYLGTGNASNLTRLSSFTSADATLGRGYGDMDGDGDLDIILAKVATPPAGHMRVLRNNGDGTFAAEVPVLCHVGFGVTNGAPMADFNGDGNLDIACANGTAAEVGIHPGNGDGTFQTFAAISTSNNPSFASIADFNGDGNVDVATSENGANTIGISLGNGQGSLSSHGTSGAITSPTVITIADFNNDGKMDIVSQSTTANIAVLLGN